MSQKPPTRAMRGNPDLDQLERQAKELFEAYRASAAEAEAEVLTYHHAPDPDTFALHDAQLVLARSYGFESWPKLKAAVEGVTAAKLHEAVESGDLTKTRDLLTRRPEIVDLGRGEMRPLHMAVMRRDLAMTRISCSNSEPIRTRVSGPAAMQQVRMSSRANGNTRRLPKRSKPSPRSVAPAVPSALPQ